MGDSENLSARIPIQWGNIKVPERRPRMVSRKKDQIKSTKLTFTSSPKSSFTKSKKLLDIRHTRP